MLEVKKEYMINKLSGGMVFPFLVVQKKKHIKIYMKQNGYHFNKKIGSWIKGKLRKNLDHELKIEPIGRLEPEQFKTN